ncbi:N-acetylneuraminate lyase B-like [Lineus longissimus]|uniref:N-acetylneuraminate lyase B-like n=1 Tax=Lineus longissimus TaxID=88925 RepID=UPI002B4F8C71
MAAIRNYRVKGLISPPYTPYKENGDVDLDKIDAYVDLLHKNKVLNVYVNGTTGEGPSLSLEERKQSAVRWVKAGRGKLENVIIQVGCTSLPEAKQLAAHAQSIGASAIACLPPWYYKNMALDDIVDFCAQVAACAPNLPFFYYHIPSFTEVNIKMADFFELAKDKMPTLVGTKFTDLDFMDASAVANSDNKRFQVMSGWDQMHIAALGYGLGEGVVGAFYNFMPQVAHRLIAAFERGDLEEARKEQFRLNEIVRLNKKYSTGFILRDFMTFIGLDIGPPRLPLRPLPAEKRVLLQKELETIGFFDWIKE